MMAVGAVHGEDDLAQPDDDLHHDQLAARREGKR
jgi:hypothetical protein